MRFIRDFFEIWQSERLLCQIPLFTNTRSRSGSCARARSLSLWSGWANTPLSLFSPSSILPFVCVFLSLSLSKKIQVSQFAHYRGCQCTLVYDAAGNAQSSPNTQVFFITIYSLFIARLSRCHVPCAQLRKYPVFFLLFSARWVVISRAFLFFFPCNHIINIKKNSFSGEVKDSVLFPFYFWLHKHITTYIYVQHLCVWVCWCTHTHLYPHTHTHTHTHKYQNCARTPGRYLWRKACRQASIPCQSCC